LPNAVVASGGIAGGQGCWLTTGHCGCLTSGITGAVKDALLGEVCQWCRWLTGSWSQLLSGTVMHVLRCASC